MAKAVTGLPQYRPSLDTEPAPPEICGELPRCLHHQELHARRIEWIRERIFEGHTQASIARALGVTAVNVFKLVRLYGLDQDMPTPPGLLMLMRCKIGAMRAAFDDAPRATQYKLIRIAAANRITIAEAAIRIITQTGGGNGQADR